jgi:undecaprenyl-diphosphatase
MTEMREGTIQENTATGQKAGLASYWRVLVLALLLTPLGVLAYYAHERPYFAWDVTIANWVLDIPDPGVDTFMEMVSWMGTKIGILIFILVTAGVATRLLGWRAGVLVLSVNMIIGVNEQLKELIGRPRPGELITIGSKSFPSGHVLHAVLLPGVIWLLARPRLPKQHHQLMLAAVAIAWVVLVGLSRIHLERHWPSDVLGAYLLGVSALWAMAWVVPVLDRIQIPFCSHSPSKDKAS